MKLNAIAPKKSRAQAMVEFAIVLPLLLLLLYGLLEAGRLLFIYSSIVTATRQASRYGSASGQGQDYTSMGGPNNTSIQRYQDCYGIRYAAQRVDFLDSFDDSDITIQYDNGEGTPVSGFDGSCDGDADPDVNPSPNNDSRIVVTIAGNYFPIVPRIVPFLERSDTSANGPIRASSARTIIIGISIEVTSPPGSGVPGPGTNTLSLAMTASPSTYAFAGDVITFTYTLSNSGTADLSGLTLTATHGTVSCPGTTLAVGASMTCTGTYVITSADISAGSVVAQASATASDGTNTVTSNTATTTLTFTVLPQLSLAKAASTEYATAGGVVGYTYTLTNSGNVPLSAPYAVTDDKTAVSCPDTADIPPGGSTTCTASYQVTNQDIRNDQLVNTARASAMFGTQTINSNQATATVYTGPLYLRASASPGSLSAPGQINYSYELINNTGVTLYPPYTISGHRGTENCTTTTSSIGVGGSITCTGSYTVTQTDLDTQTSLTNSITVTACNVDNNCNNASKRVTSYRDTVTVTLVRNPALSLGTLNATYATPVAAGTVITYTYTVTNTGNVTLSPSITDTLLGTVPCAANLAPGATQTCTGTYTVTQADLDAGLITNQATATATFNSQTVSSTSQSFTLFTYEGPRLRLQITPNPTSFTGVGEFIVYTYTIRNTGSVPLNGPYVINDSKVTFVDCSGATSPLAVGASTTCVGSYATTQADVDAGNVINSASVTGSDGTQSITSNSAMAVVYVPGAPTLTPSPTNTGVPTATYTPTPTRTSTPTSTP